MTDLHPVPTPRDPRPVSHRDDVAAVGRAVAEACGLDGDVYEAELRNVPVLDLPQRADVPVPSPRRRGVVVTLHPTARGRLDDFDVPVPEGTRWSRAAGELLVFADGGVEVASFARGTWVRVAFAPQNGRAGEVDA